jgi:hypothetical protein
MAFTGSFGVVSIPSEAEKLFCIDLPSILRLKIITEMLDWDAMYKASATQMSSAISSGTSALRCRQGNQWSFKPSGEL